MMVKQRLVLWVQERDLQNKPHSFWIRTLEQTPSGRPRMLDTSVMWSFPTHLTIRTIDMRNEIWSIATCKVPCGKFRNVSTTIRAIEANYFIFSNVGVWVTKGAVWTLQGVILSMLVDARFAARANDDNWRTWVPVVLGIKSAHIIPHSPIL